MQLFISNTVFMSNYTLLRIVAYVINIQEEIIYSGEHFTIPFQSMTKRLLNVNV